MENNEHSWGSHEFKCPAEPFTLVEVKYFNNKTCIGLAKDFDWRFKENFIVEWRLAEHPEQSLDEAIGQQSYPEDFTIQQELVYPQTTFKPSSEAQLRSDEAARVNSLLSEKLSTISDIASKLTRKNFSVADIKLVKDLLESVEEYEESR